MRSAELYTGGYHPAYSYILDPPFCFFPQGDPAVYRLRACDKEEGDGKGSVPGDRKGTFLLAADFAP